jgi:hypothetical protein
LGGLAGFRGKEGMGPAGIPVEESQFCQCRDIRNRSGLGFPSLQESVLDKHELGHKIDTSSDPKAQQRYRILFWLCLSGVTLLRLMIAGSFGLGVDESHYVIYSRHLAWGYYDHPPMVAFLAYFTHLLGDGFFFARLGPIICSTASFIVLRRLALSLYRDERIAFCSFVVLNLMPFQHLLTVSLLPDATLNLFWGCALLTFWTAVQTGRFSLWLATGVFFGCALLSKYHAVLLPGCLFLFLISSRGHRFLVKKPAFWVMLLVGFLIFLPNVLWNQQNDWVSYKYQFGHGTRGSFAVDKIFTVFGAQLGVWSPLIFALLIVTFVILLRQKSSSPADRFTLWTSLPVFAFFCGIGTTGEILPHWVAVGWFTGSIALSSLVLARVHLPGKQGLRWRRWSLAAGLIGLFTTAGLYAGMYFPILPPLYNKARDVSLALNQWIPVVKPMEPFKPEFDITNELHGWDQIAEKVEAVRRAMPRPEKTFVFCHRFYTTSQLAVHLHPDTVATTLGPRLDQYRLWFSPSEHTGWDALYIAEDRFGTEPARYLPLFQQGETTSIPFTVTRNRLVAREIEIYRCYGFKGKFKD